MSWCWLYWLGVLIIMLGLSVMIMGSHASGGSLMLVGGLIAIYAAVKGVGDG